MFINVGSYVGEGSMIDSRALVGGLVYSATDHEPLVIPEEAVVVVGARPIPRGPGKDWGISLYTSVIVRCRDAKTGAKL
jgi:2,3,4,5-tetrahydropyridine-2-carboxylate N-succinyltransferase